MGWSRTNSQWQDDPLFSTTSLLFSSLGAVFSNKCWVFPFVTHQHMEKQRSQFCKPCPTGLARAISFGHSCCHISDSRGILLFNPYFQMLSSDSYRIMSCPSLSFFSYVRDPATNEVMKPQSKREIGGLAATPCGQLSLQAGEPLEDLGFHPPITSCHNVPALLRTCYT
jgi:hypothetical protein